MHAVLKVMEGKQQGALIPLGKKFLIGREEDCHLRPNSDLVSRHHCVFTVDEFTTRLRDLGSTNGTFVNGIRTTGQVVLKSGDQVRIGKLLFEVVIDVPAVVAAAVATPVMPVAVAAPVTVAAGNLDQTMVQPRPAAAAPPESHSDFVIAPPPQEEEAPSNTAILGGDTAFIAPAAKKKPVAAPIPVRLPDPDETGAKDAPPPAPKPEAEAAAAPAAVDPRSSAADIIKQYMQRKR